MVLAQREGVCARERGDFGRTREERAALPQSTESPQRQGKGAVQDVPHYSYY